MFIAGSKIADYIDGMVDPDEQIQPVGVDLTVGKIERITQGGAVDLDNSKREVPKGKELELEEDEDGDLYYPLKDMVVRVTTNEKVTIPEDKIALTWPRSTLLRMGMQGTMAVGDPGYSGIYQFVLAVPYYYEPVDVYKNARVGQITFADAVAEEEYDGRYGADKAVDKETEKVMHDEDEETTTMGPVKGKSPSPNDEREIPEEEVEKTNPADKEQPDGADWE